VNRARRVGCRVCVDTDRIGAFIQFPVQS